MLLLLLAAAAIHTDFEGGSLGKIQRISPQHFRCGLKGEVDQDGRNRQANWYYFRLDQAGGRETTIDLVDLAGEYNYRPNKGAVTRDTPPVYSYDQKHWTHFEDIEYDAETPKLRLKFTPRSSRMWIAHVPPYTNRDLALLLKEFALHPHLQRAVIGKTIQGRDLLQLTVTNPAVTEASKKVVWLMIRQHSWETGSSWAGEGALRFLLSSDPRVVRIRDRIIFHIFPLCDPDGVARGGVRFNLRGFDLNRNWDTVDLQKMPEIAAQRKAVLSWVDAGRTLDLFLSVHNTETSEYLDGPPGAGEGKFTQLSDRFFRLLKEKTSFDPTRPLRYSEPTTTPGKAGRMTVAQGLYRDRKIPAFLMEQRIAFNSRLGHLPNVQDRLDFGRGLALAMCAAVDPALE